MAATATVKGGFWAQFGGTLTQVQGTSPMAQRIRTWMSRKSMRPQRAIMRVDNGAVVGGAAAATTTRIANSTELGGKRTIETETLINRVTVAGDVTQTNADLFGLNAFDSTPIENKDGNPLGTR